MLTFAGMLLEQCMKVDGRLTEHNIGPDTLTTTQTKLQWAVGSHQPDNNQHAHPYIRQITWLASTRSEAQVLVCLPVCGTPYWVSLQHSTMCRYFSSSSVVSRNFFVLCVYSKFRHHPHPLDYLCAKFCCFRGLHCWASQWRKIVYSITHSPSIFDALETEALALWNCTYTVSQKWHRCSTLQLRRTTTDFGNFWQRCCWDSMQSNSYPTSPN